MLPFGKKRRVIAKTAILNLLVLSFLANPAIVVTTAANYLNVTAPAEVTKTVAFTIQVEISAQENSTYHLKSRIGQGSTLNKGQTLDPTTGIWLSDSVSWDRFPTFQTDSNGHWTGQLSALATASAPVGDNSLTVRIKPTESSNTIDSQTYVIKLSEPQAAPTPQPKTILVGEPILNEFMASPASGETEWVEIKNKGNTSADISGWKIDDEPGKSTPFVIGENTILNPGQFFVAHFSSPKLNDSADQVRLLRPDDSMVETHAYSNPEKGRSFAKDSTGSWFITEPTPGSTNPNPPSVLAANSAKNSGNSTQLEEGKSEEITEDNPLPKLNGATRSATIAAVAVTKQPTTQLLNIGLMIAGIVLVIASILIVFKDKWKKLLPKNKQELPLTSS